MAERANSFNPPPRREIIPLLAYIPLHLAILPLLIGFAAEKGIITLARGNLIYYLIGLAYMLVFGRRLLRRDFDTLCDNYIKVLLTILSSYFAMLLMNLGLGTLLGLILKEFNPNNEAIMSMAGEDYGPVAAMSIFMAPIVEELIFRAGIFGALSKRSRIAAYAVSILLFSVYHVWAYALAEPMYWLYVIQYIPVSYLLCRCYEKTDCIWTGIFFHMLVNGISLKALSLLEDLL